MLIHFKQIEPDKWLLAGAPNTVSPGGPFTVVHDVLDHYLVANRRFTPEAECVAFGSLMYREPGQEKHWRDNLCRLVGHRLYFDACKREELIAKGYHRAVKLYGTPDKAAEVSARLQVRIQELTIPRIKHITVEILTGLMFHLKPEID